MHNALAAISGLFYILPLSACLALGQQTNINGSTEREPYAPIQWVNRTDQFSDPPIPHDPHKLYCNYEALQPAQPAYFGEPELWQCYSPAVPSSTAQTTSPPAIVLQMKFQNKRPAVPPNVNLGELMIAANDGLANISQQVALTNNGQVPYSPTLSEGVITTFSHGNTIIYLETPPCEGSVAQGPFLESKMQVPRYSDVALWLNDLVNLIVNKASPNLDVGSGQVFGYSGRWEPVPIDYRLRRHMGVFNVQTKDSEFTPLSRVFGYQYKCEGGGGGGGVSVSSATATGRPHDQTRGQAVTVE